jgi:hypothetical protein
VKVAAAARDTPFSSQILTNIRPQFPNLTVRRQVEKLQQLSQVDHL